MELVPKQTGELIPAGTYTLESCASELREVLTIEEKNNWKKGKLLSIARALCDSPDCGIEGDNPKARFGNWVSINFTDTSSHALLNFRRMYEVFGDRREQVEQIPQSGLYELSRPECDPVREKILRSLPEKPTVKDVQEAVIRELQKDTIALLHTGDEESYTPEMYIQSARKVMGDIELDPASNDMAQETVMAAEYYTAEDDGLTRDWHGKVWMNPPYTALVINKFITKLVDSYNDGAVTEAIVLTNNNTDTSWFHEAMRNCTAICFTAGRVNFIKRDKSLSSPTNGQAFIYFGDNLRSFIDEFAQYGAVVEVVG